LLRLEPGSQYFRVQTDLGSDVEGQLDDASLGVSAEAYAVGASNADQQVRQAGSEGLVLDKSLLLALNQTRKEQDGLLDDPLVKGARGDLGDGDVDLLCCGEGNAWVGQGTAGLVVEEVRELLEADLDVLGGFVVVSEVG
jgi:hypothetical protein